MDRNTRVAYVYMQERQLDYLLLILLYSLESPLSLGPRDLSVLSSS